MEIPKAIQRGLRAIAVVGITLYSLPSSIEGQISPLEVFVKCDNSRPTVEVISNIAATEDQDLWLTVTPAGRRDIRLLEKGKERLSLAKQYTGVFESKEQYTDSPRNPLKMEQGKRFIFGIHYGSVNKLGNPRLTETILEVERVIPSCPGTNQS